MCKLDVLIVSAIIIFTIWTGSYFLIEGYDWWKFPLLGTCVGMFIIGCYILENGINKKESIFKDQDNG